MSNLDLNVVEEVQIVSFYLGTDIFGISLEKIQEIIRNKSIVSIPNAPYFIEGVINLRGNVIPIISLRKKINYVGEQLQNNNNKIIICYIKDILAGLEVDEVDQIYKYSEEQVSDISVIGKVQKKEYISRIVKKDSRLIQMINLNSLLSEKEKNGLRETSLSNMMYS